jgi:hypothetical protein
MCDEMRPVTKNLARLFLISHHNPNQDFNWSKGQIQELVLLTIEFPLNLYSGRHL